jgi:SAM-dependent methyltransferase
VRRIQEAGHPEGHDYRSGSPHLSHWKLYQGLLSELREVLDSLRARGLPWSVLDVGAGHGSFTEPLLAYGCAVTATEMSRPSLDALRSRYRDNDRFSAVLDRDGSFGALDDRTYGLVLFASVLHHIPDYRAALEAAGSRVVPGGSIVTLQDPLWYPTLRRTDSLLSRLAYLWWRLGQGSYRRGLASRWRWARGIYEEANASDMIEYHVVRQGVDQGLVRDALASRFKDVRLIRYWSTQSSLWQRLGEEVGATNTFACIATDRI